MQKKEIKDDYKDKISKLAKKLSVEINEWNLDSLFTLLDKYMAKYKYMYVRSNNIYTTFNEANLEHSTYAMKYGVIKSMHYRWNCAYIPLKKILGRIIKYLSKKITRYERNTAEIK